MPPKRIRGRAACREPGSAQVPVFLGVPAPLDPRSEIPFTAGQAGSVPVVEHCVAVEVVPVVEAARRRPHTVTAPS